MWNIVAIEPESNYKRGILTWVEFTIIVQRTDIINDVFITFDGILSLNEKDIKDLSEVFGLRTANNRRINFGICRTKKFKVMLHWFQDFKRVSSTPSIDGLTQDDFLAALTVSSVQYEIKRSFARSSRI